MLIVCTVRTISAVLGCGAALSVLLSTFTYTGDVLSGYNKDPDVDEFERREGLRKNRRRPIQETLEELGEGRGNSGLSRPFPGNLNNIHRYLWPGIR